MAVACSLCGRSIPSGPNSEPLYMHNGNWICSTCRDKFNPKQPDIPPPLPEVSLSSRIEELRADIYRLHERVEALAAEVGL